MRHDDDAERIVLGALMTDPRIVDDVLASGITARDFYEPRHEIIFAAILDASRATPDSVADAVTTALDDPAYSLAAERIRDEIAALPGAGATVPLLEGLLHKGTALPPILPA